LKHLFLLLKDPQAQQVLGVAEKCVRLTGREGKILFQMVRAAQAKDVAAQMGIAPATVSVRLKHLREGLGLHTQAEVNVWAQSHVGATHGEICGRAQHPEGCICGSPGCEYALHGRPIAVVPVLLTTAKARALLKRLHPNARLPKKIGEHPVNPSGFAQLGR
jgi:DNA-binding CsgD family transcriptional regulator